MQSGSITVDAKGSAEVLYGNMGAGRIETEGDFTVSGKDSVYVDSDLHIGGDLRLNSDGEIVLDLSNMGSYNSTDSDGNVISGKDNLHENFLDHFKNDGTEGKGTIKVGGVENAVNADNFMIAIDMWDYQNNEFDLDKYDRDDNDTLAGDINSLKITMDGIELGAEKPSTRTTARRTTPSSGSTARSSLQAYRSTRTQTTPKIQPKRMLRTSLNTTSRSKTTSTLRR